MDCVKWKVIFAALLLLALTSLITDVFAHTEISYAVLPLTEHSEPYTKHLLDLIRSTPMLYLIEPPAGEDVIVRVVLTVYENGTVKPRSGKLICQG
jgi:hypothetical protein